MPFVTDSDGNKVYQFDENNGSNFLKNITEQSNDNIPTRLLGNAYNSYAGAINSGEGLVRNAAAALGLVNPEIDKIKDMKIDIPAPSNTGESIADIAGKGAGEIGKFLTLKSVFPFEKIGGAITGGLTSKGVGAGASKILGNTVGGIAENLIPDTMINVSNGIGENKSAGDIAKDVGQSAIWDTILGGVLGGGSAAAGIAKANKTAKIAKAEEAQKAAEQATKEAVNTVTSLSDQVANSLGKTDAAENIAKEAVTPPAEAVNAGKTVLPDTAADAGAAPAKASSMALNTQGTTPTLTGAPKSFDDVVKAQGDKKSIYNMYDALSKEDLSGSININGVDVPKKRVIDAWDTKLPDTAEELEPVVNQYEQAYASIYGNKVGPGIMNLDPRSNIHYKLDDMASAGLYAAKRKLEYLKLESGEGGSKIRGFFANRMIGNDEISSPELLKALSGSPEKYTPKSDAILQKEAQDLLSNGDIEFYNQLMKYKKGKTLNDQQVRAAEMMIDRFYRSGDQEKVADLIHGVSRYSTENARALRAYSMKKITNPTDVLTVADKQIKKGVDSVLNEGAADEIDDLAAGLAEKIRASGGNMSKADIQKMINDAIETVGDDQSKLKKLLFDNSQSLAERIIAATEKGALTDSKLRETFLNQLKLPALDTETADKLVRLSQAAGKMEEGSAEQTKLFQQIYETIGEKLPVSKVETLQAWRKLAMLYNPKTHIRNFTANVAMVPMRKINDFLAEGMERLLPAEYRTRSLGWSMTEKGQAILKSEEFQKTAQKANQEMLDFSKYDFSDSNILRNRKMYGKSWLGEFLNRRAAKNGALLDKEDRIMFGRAFQDNLGQFMTARNLDKVTDEAYEFAKGRALEATFRADNIVNDVITSFKHVHSEKFSKLAGGWNQIADVIMPFSKTPANLLTQAFQYSPAGLGVSAGKLIAALKGKNGKAAADAIYGLAKGIDGTALMALGLYMGGSGLINTVYPSGEKQRAAGELAGQQQNSVKIGNSTITIDWLQPISFPLILGASIGQNMAKNELSDSKSFPSNLWSSISAGLDSVFDLSVFQSLQEATKNGLSQGATTLATNALTQSIPTVFGQLARSIDTTQRKTTGNNELDTIWRRVLARVPGASRTLEPELDIWGNEVKRGNTNNVLENAFNQFFNPANVSHSLYPNDAATQTISDIYKNTGSTKAIPSSPNKEDYSNVSDYTSAAKQVGQAQYTAMQKLDSQPNKAYKLSHQVNGKTKYYVKKWGAMTDDEKAKVISNQLSIDKLWKGVVG